MKVIINPYHKSVTIDGVEVVQKFINFPDALNHLASISCDYDRDSQTITDVQDVHRYVSHAIEKQYYYKHLPEFVNWFYAEQQAQLDNAISVEQQIVAANTAAQNAATSAENAKLEAEEAKKTNQNTQQAVDNAVAKITQAGSTLPVKSDGTDVARTLGERFADVVNVKDFGAVGDGITDDSAAFQAAINTGKNVFIPTAENEEYIVNNVLFNGGSQAVFAMPQNGVFGRIASTSTAFIVNNENCRFSGLTFYTDTADIAVKINGNTENGASGTVFSRCSFKGYNIAIDNNGRGLTVIECNFSNIPVCVRQNYTHDGESLQSLVYGNRAFRFINNHIHGLSYAIRNESGILRGAIICGNLMDIGSMLIWSAASIVHSLIKDNVCSLSTRPMLEFTSGDYTSNIIVGNVFEGRSEEYTPNHAILVAEDCSFANNIVSKNTYATSGRDAIQLNCAAAKCVFDGNIFDNIAISGTSAADACIKFSSLTQCVISNNVFSQATTISALRGITTAATVEGSIILGNARTAEAIISACQFGDGNAIQEY